MKKNKQNNNEIAFAFAALLFEKCARIINNISDVISGEKEIKINLKSKSKRR